MFNYGFFTYFADCLLTRRIIIWLAVLGAPMLLGYGLVGTSKPAFCGLVAFDCTTRPQKAGLLKGRLAQHTTETNRGELLGLN